MLKKTPLHDLQDLHLNPTWVPFCNWEMAVHYGSVLKEHEAVRQHVGLFDVSHMTLLDIQGDGTLGFLQKLLAGDLSLCSKDAMYSCLLNHEGGIIDDLIVYKINPNRFYMILNAATYPQSVTWIQQQAPKDITITHHQNPCILALQGPKWLQYAQALLPNQAAWLKDAKPFSSHFDEASSLMLTTTGYTGESGIEIITTDQALGQKIWQQSMEKGIQPCGLGARDLLRLEMGYMLSTQDMDTNHTPLTSRLGWTVSWHQEDRHFIGKDALLNQKNSPLPESSVGIVLQGKGVLRHGQNIVDEHDQMCGTITSGAFSPMLQQAIGLARIKKEAQSGPLFAIIRDKKIAIAITRPPFYQKET